MSTRVSLSLAASAILSLGLPGCATAAQQVPVPPAFTLQGGEHLRIVSGYLRDEPGAIVRGFVRRDPLWRGPINGHLHVTAYAATGDVIARRATTWSGRFTGRHSPSLSYHADLKVPRADVARVAVVFAHGRHAASESFQ